MALTEHQVQRAIGFNRRRLDDVLLPLVRRALGLAPLGPIDEALVQSVARWQGGHMPAGEADGMVGFATEAHLAIQHPAARRAADAAQRMYASGGILFDSWSNDMRDNDLDGLVDERDEYTPDGMHYGRSYRRFDVVRGTYRGGWRGARRDVTVRRDQRVTGQFRYAVCADLISDAYAAAGVMSHHGSTRAILAELRRKGYVWRRSESYPDRYLPGDYIATWEPGGGHSGIVVAEGPTDGGAQPPEVIELPGPSSQVTDGTYTPSATSDVVRHRWSSWRVSGLPHEKQYLGRLLHSRMPV